MVKEKPLGFSPGDRYRFVPERRIVEMLLLLGFSCNDGFPNAQEYVQQKLDLWVSQGLPFRPGEDDQRLFDPIEVNNYFRLVGKEDRDDFLSTQTAPNYRRMVEDLADHAIGGEYRATVEFKRTFSLEGVAPGTKLRLRAPSPLGGKYLKQIETKPWVEAADIAEVVLGPGRLEARLTTAGEAVASIGARFDFTVLCQEGDEGGEIDRELYLKEQEGLISVSPKLREMAGTLAPQGTPPLEAIRAFWEYLNHEMIFGSVHYDQIDLTSPSEWTAEHGWYDCQTGAALLSTLCRASGIPARLVCGYILNHRAPGKHYWMEAWLEDRGWTPFDLMSWDLSEGGRDIGWRDRYFGKIDYRLMLERMPREFTGAIGVPLPPAWIFLPLPEQGGTAGYFHSIDGRLIYSDVMRVMN